MKTKAESLRALIDARPVPVRLDQPAPVRTELIRREYGRLMLFHAAEPGLGLRDWAGGNRALIEGAFEEHGALLFRGFSTAEETFRQFALEFAGELMDYSEPSTPRTRIADKLYTSTEYPKEQFIPPHNEHSYSRHWPSKIWFYCAKPAPAGGETPISDSRRVYELIDPRVRELFAGTGVMYVRNFGGRLDLKWQDFFGTDDARAVEAYCREASIEFEWTGGGGLRTRQVCQAVIEHPRTKEALWFNQAHLFHVSNLVPQVREYLLENFGEEHLPRNAYLGDGTPIPPAALEEIRAAYRRTQIVFDWQRGDVLMLDNMLHAHGRNPFEGERHVLVAMADPAAGPPPTRREPTASGQEAVGRTRRQTARHFVKDFGREQDHETLKYKLAAAYRIMVAEGLDEGGVSGHITLRVPGQPGRFWVNPFGLLAEEVTPANLIKVDESGNIIEGEHPVNVAGFCIHAAIHKARPDVACAVHTHSPWGTLFSALGRTIEPIDQNCCMFFENHALHAEYNGPVNDHEDALRLVRALDDKAVVVLRNHGTITCGESVESAVMLTVAIERAYRLNVLARGAGELELIAPDVARQTRDWIANPIGLAVEFNALLRKVERLYPEFRSFRPGQPPQG
jgi:ribulose-5-phosphate 4-epimerase/fuculose-1-phosphate aldolase/alpha-ketoglutarate-dependent taurine dioxygenase